MKPTVQSALFLSTKWTRPFFSPPRPTLLFICLLSPPNYLEILETYCLDILFIAERNCSLFESFNGKECLLDALGQFIRWQWNMASGNPSLIVYVRKSYRTHLFNLFKHDHLWSSMIIYVLVWLDMTGMCVFQCFPLPGWVTGGKRPQIHRRTEFLDYDPDSACGRRTTSTLLGKVPLWIGGHFIFDWIPPFLDIFGMFTSFLDQLRWQKPRVPVDFPMNQSSEKWQTNASTSGSQNDWSWSVYLDYLSSLWIPLGSCSFPYFELFSVPEMFSDPCCICMNPRHPWPDDILIPRYIRYGCPSELIGDFQNHRAH